MLALHLLSLCVCLSDCLSVTSWYCIAMTGRTEIVLACGKASFHLSHIVWNIWNNVSDDRLSWSVGQSIMLKFTWRRFDQSAKQLVVGQRTINRWRTVVSGTWKYDDPRLNMSHEGAAYFPWTTVRHMFCRLTNYKNLEIIRKLKSYSPLYLHDINTQARRVIFSVSKTLSDFGHKNSFKVE